LKRFFVGEVVFPLFVFKCFAFDAVSYLRRVRGGTIFIIFFANEQKN